MVSNFQRLIYSSRKEDLRNPTEGEKEEEKKTKRVIFIPMRSSTGVYSETQYDDRRHLQGILGCPDEPLRV